MTLCIAWRDRDNVHFVSDSRLTTAPNSYTDVAIKVLPLAINIYSPRSPNGERTLDYCGEIGMCFAGSAVNSLFLKETIAELLKELQYAPGYTDISMDGLARFVFNAYKQISINICQTAISRNGTACVVIAGHCPETSELKSYILETDDNNQHSMREILVQPGDFEVIGSGKRAAEALLPVQPTKREFLSTVKAVAEDILVPSVGGPLQYGYFRDSKFRCCGIIEYDSNSVRYWRGGLDVNSADFISGAGNFVPGFTFLDGFDA